MAAQGTPTGLGGADSGHSQMQHSPWLLAAAASQPNSEAAAAASVAAMLCSGMPLALLPLLLHGGVEGGEGLGHGIDPGQHPLAVCWGQPPPKLGLKLVCRQAGVTGGGRGQGGG